MNNFSWISIEEKKPPYDTLVLLVGMSEWGSPLFCLAFNNNYPPNMDLCCTFDELIDEDRSKLRSYYPPSFKPTHWVEVPIDGPFLKEG